LTCAKWTFNITKDQTEPDVNRLRSLSPEVARVMPAGSTDAHVHVFDPLRFRFAPARSYTPGAATLVQLRAHLAGTGLRRVVLVQPSVYGSDNACLLDAMAQLGPEVARGIACVDLDTATPDLLLSLHRAGVRGIRLNFEVRDEHNLESVRRQLAAAARQIDLPGWCVQVHCEASLLSVVEYVLNDFRVPVVLDHFAGVRVANAGGLAGQSQTVLRLLSSGRVYVKLSAFYRASQAAPSHDDLMPLVRPWLQARPDRLLWGSDWPHTGGGAGSGIARDPARVEPFRDVDVPASLHSLCTWCETAEVFQKVLSSNPAALYGFSPTTA
jgi:predicted TIM-barrel fold metal-dependent hydrolase